MEYWIRLPKKGKFFMKAAAKSNKIKNTLSTSEKNTDNKNVIGFILAFFIGVLSNMLSRVRANSDMNTSGISPQKISKYRGLSHDWDRHDGVPPKDCDIDNVLCFIENTEIKKIISKGDIIVNGEGEIVLLWRKHGNTFMEFSFSDDEIIFCGKADFCGVISKCFTAKEDVPSDVGEFISRC